MEDYKPPLGGTNPEPIFILGSLEEDDEEEDEYLLKTLKYLPEMLNKPKKRTKDLTSIITELIKSKSLLLTDSSLLQHLPMHTAYLMNKEDYDEIIKCPGVASSVLIPVLENLGFPICTFNFKKKTLKVYSLSYFGAYKGSSNSSDDYSILLYHFAKARLDKDYLRDIERLYL
jgi:hypothetical protein